MATINLTDYTITHNDTLWVFNHDVITVTNENDFPFKVRLVTIDDGLKVERSAPAGGTITFDIYPFMVYLLEQRGFGLNLCDATLLDQFSFKFFAAESGAALTQLSVITCDDVRYGCSLPTGAENFTKGQVYNPNFPFPFYTGNGNLTWSDTGSSPWYVASSASKTIVDVSTTGVKAYAQTAGHNEVCLRRTMPDGSSTTTEVVRLVVERGDCGMMLRWLTMGGNLLCRRFDIKSTVYEDGNEVAYTQPHEGEAYDSRNWWGGAHQSYKGSKTITRNLYIPKANKNEMAVLMTLVGSKFVDAYDAANGKWYRVQVVGANHELDKKPLQDFEVSVIIPSGEAPIL